MAFVEKQEETSTYIFARRNVIGSEFEMDSWSPRYCNRRDRRGPYCNMEIMLQKAIIRALSSRDSPRLFGFLVISFSVTQIVLLGHPSLAPVMLIPSLEPEIDYSTRPYSSHVIVSEKSNLLFLPGAEGCEHELEVPHSKMGGHGRLRGSHARPSP